MNVTIEIDEQEAEKYKLFCQHYDKVLALISGGVFDTKGSSVILNFDQQGVLQNIVKPVTKYDVLYSLSKKNLTP